MTRSASAPTRSSAPWGCQLPEYVIGLRIQATSDTAALEQARKQLALAGAEQAKIIKQSQAGGGALAGFANSLKSLFLGMVAPMALAYSAIRLISQGIKDAIAKRDALRGLAATVNTLGQNGRAAAEAASALGDSLERLGIDDTEVIAATRDLTRVTGDYRQALSAASLAADLAKKSGISYGEALNMLSMVLAGRVPRSLKAFGISATDAAGALAQIERFARGAAAQMDGDVEKINQARATWNQFWEDIGDGAVTAGARLIDFARTGGEALARLAASASAALSGNLVGALKALQAQKPGADLKSAADFPLLEGGHARLAVREDPEALAKAAADAAKLRAAGEIASIESVIVAHERELASSEATAARKQAAFERLKVDYKSLTSAQIAALRVAEAEDLRTTEGTEADKQNIREAYRLKREALIRAGATAEIEAAEQVTEAIKAEKIRQLAAESAIDDQRAQAAIDNAKAQIALLETEAANVFTSPERLAAITAEITALKAHTLALELDNIERRKRNALDLADVEGKTATEKSAIAGGFDAEAAAVRAAAEQVVAADANAFDERLKHLLSYGQAADAERKRQLAEDLAAINARLAAVKKGSAEEAALIRARNALQATANAEQLQAALGKAAAVIGVLQGAFPESKALASASAFINMLAGATAALAPPPLGLGPVAGIPLAAATIAAGFANIAKINATNPASGAGANFGKPATDTKGFDNPAHDRMARDAGLAWGRQSAGDMVAQWFSGAGQGFREALAGASQGGTERIVERTVTNTTERGGTVIQNNSYLWGSDARAEAAKASRIIERGQRRTRRSRLGGGGTVLGGE